MVVKLFGVSKLKRRLDRWKSQHAATQLYIVFEKVVYLYFEGKHLACLVILIHVIQAILVRGK